MPEQPDDDRVPPLKVMRKRLNGVYRADTGFSGPTRRYVLIVALLVGLASVPTLAAITAGSSEIADGGTDTMDIPFLPPASPGPIQSPPDARVGASPYALPPGAGEAIARAGRLLGEAGRRHPTTKIKRPTISYVGKHSTPKRDAGRPKASPRPGRSPSMIAFPSLPGMPALPHLPAVSGRSAPRQHHDADPSRHQDADSHRHHDADSHRHQDADSPTDPSTGLPADPPVDPPADIVDPAQLARSAFPDMSDEDHCSHHHRRRSVVPERPHNIRAASILERSYAQGSLNTRHPRTDDNRGDGSYRGSHRAGSRHHTDDLQAQLRSSRVGRHHAEPSEDLTGRW